MRQWLTFLVGGLCLTLASSAQALGVGEPQQLSPLNRPLHVVLPLTDGRGLETSQISVAIADDAAYRQSGLTRSALTDTVSAKVVREGRMLSVVLDSPRRVKEPFLDLLLVVTWPEGQWQREISLLFDPVDYASAPPLIDGDRSAWQGREALASLATNAMAAGVPVTGDTHSESTRRGTLAWPSRVTVRPGDSLSTLAASLLPQPGVSREALMLALFQSNASAFIGSDPDRLRAGVGLNVPLLDDVAVISRHEAAATLAELSGTQDDRPVIDIVGRENALATTEVPPSAQLAMLTQRLSDLTAETERQRATIDTLQAERDALQGALAVRGTRDVRNSAAATIAPVTVVPDRLKPDGATDGMNADTTKAGVATSGAVAAAVAAAPGPSPTLPSPSFWKRLLVHLDWIGGAILVVLLGLWIWQRRRQRSRHVAPSPSRSPATDTLAKQESATSRRPVARDADSGSISQADIYMAYGRHGEARDWLRQRLAQTEDAHLRLGLLKALGELREMEALEEALSGFGYDATSEQRREGRELADHYRARYVEESWQEATADDAESEVEGENIQVFSGDVQDVDALFEAQVTPLETSADLLRSSRRDDLGGAEDRYDSASAPFDDEWLVPQEASDISLTATSIDYEAPTLELNVPTTDDVLPSSSTSSDAGGVSSDAKDETSRPMPTIDFSALSLEPISAAAVADDDSRHVVAVNSHAPREDSRNETPEAAPKPSAGKPDGEHRGVPAGWDVEEVEFQSSHRDNGRP
ncbi:type IV pilus assembly protein FimV [Salinicola halimionae]|uniref:type IV pilus assembly protein FimV n=1 Tax=Salinicola halimionae TaxID=1949081 RepID=UPI000DA1786B|nr:hypothetical protein [Salinicola halimionae]